MPLTIFLDKYARIHPNQLCTLKIFRSDESGCPDPPLCGEDDLNLRVYPIEQTIEEGI